MQNGFILMHRKIRQSWLYKRPDYYLWFTDFLFRANFKDNNNYLFDGKFISIKRGDFITSYRNLAKELPKCSEQKARTFINLLIKDKIVRIKSLKKATQVTILNYDSYQGEQHNSNTTATQQQHNSNNNRKKEKKEKKDNIIISPKIFYENQLSLANGLKKEYKEFISALFGDNDLERELTGVLSITNQVTSIQFEKLFKLKVIYGESLLNVITSIENDSKYFKNKTDLYRTIRNWIKPKIWKK